MSGRFGCFLSGRFSFLGIFILEAQASRALLDVASWVSLFWTRLVGGRLPSSAMERPAIKGNFLSPLVQEGKFLPTRLPTLPTNRSMPHRCHVLTTTPHASHAPLAHTSSPHGSPFFFSMKEGDPRPGSKTYRAAMAEQT